MLHLRSYQDYMSLPETAWKIKQPPDDDETGREEALEGGGLDLILMPGQWSQNQCFLMGTSNFCLSFFLQPAEKLIIFWFEFSLPGWDLEKLQHTRVNIFDLKFLQVFFKNRGEILVF